MKFSLSDGTDGNFIQAYYPNRIRINGRDYAASLILTPEQIISDWGPRDYRALNSADFEPLLALQPDLVLLGTGTRQELPHPSLYQALISAGIGLEYMTTPAACRTFNILSGEGRRVAAALLLGDGT